MAARQVDKSDMEETSENESADDSDEQDASDDSSYEEDSERSSDVHTAERNGYDEQHNGQRPVRRCQARYHTATVQKIRQNYETDGKPAMREAVDAVVRKGMSIDAAAKRHHIRYKSLRLTVVKTGYRPRGPATKAQIDAAVQDTVERCVPIYKAAKLHKVHYNTLQRVLKERNLVRGIASKSIVKPQIQEAVDAVVKKGMSMQAAAKLFRIDANKTLKPNIIKAGFQPPQNGANKAQVDAAVKDVMERRMSITAASKLHKMDFKTLRRALMDRNLTQPQKPHESRTEMAVRAVVNQKLSSKAAAKRYGTTAHSVQVGLKRRGYIFEGPSHTGKWIKVPAASSEPDTSSSAPQLNSPTDGNPTNTEKEWTDDEEDDAEDTETTRPDEVVTSDMLEDQDLTDCLQHAPADSKGAVPPHQRRSAQVNSENGQANGQGDNIESKLRVNAGRRGKGGVDSRNELPDQEIERIVDVRTQRQYLVKWQGEEEATWVDEDVFLGLTNLAIK